MNPEDRPSSFDPRRPPQWSEFKTVGSERPKDSRAQQVISFIGLVVMFAVVGMGVAEYLHFRSLGGSGRRRARALRREVSMEKPNHAPYLIGGAAAGSLLGVALWAGAARRKEDE